MQQTGLQVRKQKNAAVGDLLIFPKKQISEYKMQQLCGEVNSVFVAVEP